MSFDFAGRHVVVTGGAGALGTAVVGMLIKAGATCHIPALHAEEAARSPHRSKAQFAEGVDLTDEAGVERFYARFIAKETPLWASIHIAGGFSMSKVEATSKADFLAMVNMNAVTAFLCAREATKRFKAQDSGGRIVNVGARPALIPEQGAGMIPYTVGKAAVTAMTVAMAAELAGDGILVNAVIPSIMDTPANRRDMPKSNHSEWPKVDEVASTICFLASPENTVTRGGLVPVYGKS